MHKCKARSKAGTDQTLSAVDPGVVLIYPRFRQRENFGMSLQRLVRHSGLGVLPICNTPFVC